MLIEYYLEQIKLASTWPSIARIIQRIKYDSCLTDEEKKNLCAVIDAKIDP